MDKFLRGDKRKEIMKLAQVKTMRPVQVEKEYVKKFKCKKYDAKY
jgi:hypothetical protein